jgi:hypothetical protein
MLGNQSQIEELKRQLAARDKAVASSQSQIEELKRQIEELKRQLAARDNVIAGQNGTIISHASSSSNIPPPPPPPPEAKKPTQDMCGRPIDENGHVIGTDKKSPTQSGNQQSPALDHLALIQQGAFKRNLTPTEKSAEMAKAANQKVQEAAQIVKESQDSDAVKQALKTVIVEVEQARSSAKAAKSQLEMSQKNVLVEKRRQEIQTAVETAKTAKKDAVTIAREAEAAAKLLIGDREVDAIIQEAKVEVANAKSDATPEKIQPENDSPSPSILDVIAKEMNKRRPALKADDDDDDDDEKTEKTESEW